MFRRTGPVRILDLFCGAGGAAVGYARAVAAVTGAMPEIVGVDIALQPNYPYDFIQEDALVYFDKLYQGYDGGLFQFDFIHASPPCQGYVQWNGINREKWGELPEHPMLIDPVRERLVATDKPYVIENVVGAPLKNPTMLCGSMFGLGVRRHRLFESNLLIMRQKGCRHSRTEIAVYGKLDGRRIWTRSDGTEVRAARYLEQAKTAMGIDWMTEWDEVKEAIPPAYTAHIGEQVFSLVAA